MSRSHINVIKVNLRDLMEHRSALVVDNRLDSRLGGVDIGVA